VSDPQLEARRLSDLIAWLRGWTARDGAERGERRRIERFHAWADAVEALAQRVEDAKREHRDLREILKAWGLGDTDKMQAIMLGAFLREFGKAPEPEYQAQQEGER
jgi:hypothetical protein